MFDAIQSRDLSPRHAAKLHSSRVYNAQKRAEAAAREAAAYPSDEQLAARARKLTDRYERLRSGEPVPLRTKRDGSPVATNLGRRLEPRSTSPVHTRGESSVIVMRQLRQAAIGVGIDFRDYRTSADLARALIEWNQTTHPLDRDDKEIPEDVMRICRILSAADDHYMYMFDRSTPPRSIDVEEDGKLLAMSVRYDRDGTRLYMLR